MKRFFLLLLIISIKISATENSMLLVIDMQTNLLSPGKGMLHVDSLQIGSLIKNVNKNIRIAKSQNIPIAYTIIEWTNPLQNYFTNNLCKKGSPGVSIDKRVEIADTLIFHKAVNNSFSNKALCDYIRQKGIKEIFIAGIMAEACISSTVLKGLKIGLKMRMIAPAIGSSTKLRLENALDKCKKRGAISIGNIEDCPGIPR
jgi:nicotinamidase-related amidase